MRSWTIGFLLLSTSSCGSQSPPPSASGVSWPEADLLFHQDPLWLGADGAYSIDLGAGRSLWLFGDTFVATSAAARRTQSAMPRNTIAIQDGRDPSTATMLFFWGRDAAGKPTSFFPDAADTWVWPGDGIRLPGGPLILFLSVERATPGQGLGFASAGWRIGIVDNPDQDPTLWAPRYLLPAPPAFDATFDTIVGSAVVLDGDYLVALAPRSDTHAGHLARFLPADLLAGVVAPQWWAGSARGWVAEAVLGGPPALVIDDAGSEASLHRDQARSAWFHVASRGFGKTTIAVRRAPEISGPWTPPADAFTPPESNGAKPFVYAAKAHPELTTGDSADLVATYATNSFTFADLLTTDGMESLYWPRFVRLLLH